MIYCFKACGAPCWLCEQCCKGISKAVDSCLEGLRQTFEPILQAPLASYVMATWAAMICVCLGAGFTFMKTDCEDPKTICLALICLAVSHAAFAFYIQRRLVCAIGKENYASMTFREIAAKATELMLYDVVFCLYAFLFAGSFFYSMYALGAMGNCSRTGAAWSAASLLAFYGFTVFWYACCWFCCQNCCASAESAVGSLKVSPQILGSSDK
eukprot:TRINITY_DN123959_c0_g1_i1.p1 TRINITY_DN123959_c0_g1~~TRINITY_DN123959_c0_g1_i1.p1  ORF type:complete len:212 (-),score=31.14 TRINITY_DN123959_c0_g1_i1:76-711(-)